MRKLFAIFIFIFSFYLARADVFWADTIFSYSSQYGERKFSASQALGPPNYLPSGCKEACAAWSPKRPDNISEYLHLGFSTPVNGKSVIIAEIQNPGAVARVYIYDKYGSEYKIYDKPAFDLDTSYRLLQIKLDKEISDIISVKIFLQNSAVLGYNSIDGVGISDEDSSFVPKINLQKGYERVVLEPLPETINSDYSERLPIISPNGKSLYFVRTSHPGNVGFSKEHSDIWHSEMDRWGDWKIAKISSKNLNNDKPNYVISVLPGENQLIVANSYGKSESGIAITEKTNEGWSEPRPIEIKDLDLVGEYSSYFLASDGRTLLIDANLGDRKDAKGGNDIWVSFLGKDSSFSRPINLGGVINSADSEHYPFLAPDMQTLYFVSYGWPGYGSADIFMSKRIFQDSLGENYSEKVKEAEDWQNWTKPINLGEPINSPAWEGGLSIQSRGEYAYLVSKRSEYSSEDIFRFKMPNKLRPERIYTFSGTVRNNISHEPISAEITYEDLSTGDEIGRVKSNSQTGKYEFILPKFGTYAFRANARGFMGVSENITILKTDTISKYSKDLSLVPLITGNKILLNNLFFDMNSYEILSNSYGELARIFQILEENENIIAKIEGHTDNVGTDENNQILSENRAKAVREYLINLGADPEQLKYEGFGESKPIKSNNSKSGRKQNRRVEFKIIDN
jgi:OmpA-OmpF porin, OOP family